MKYNNPISPEKFELTAKKKRIIKSLMYNFFQSKEYELNQNMIYTPNAFEFKMFIIHRCIFLKYINFHVSIVTHKSIWTTLYFLYENDYIILDRNDIDKDLLSNPFTRKVETR